MGGAKTVAPFGIQHPPGPVLLARDSKDKVGVVGLCHSQSPLPYHLAVP